MAGHEVSFIQRFHFTWRKGSGQGGPWPPTFSGFYIAPPAPHFHTKLMVPPPPHFEFTSSAYVYSKPLIIQTVIQIAVFSMEFYSTFQDGCLRGIVDTLK